MCEFFDWLKGVHNERIKFRSSIMVVQICLRRILVTMRCQEVLQYDGDAIVTRSHSHNLSLFAVPLSRKRMRILKTILFIAFD
jgi:hypothetical protein